MERMEQNAYAKLNLTLDVTGKREDGFHLLDTVMQSISLCDRVTLTRTSTLGIRLRTNRNYLPADQRNTAYRAASLFFDRCGLKNQGLEIAIQKRIPTRAGMGGGSADAAAVLLGLDRLYSAKLGLSTLLELGAQVGADVPFCLHGGACRCTGIGEVLEPVPPLPPCFLVVCKPPAGMSTPRAYALLDQLPPARTAATPRLLQALETGDLRQIGKSLSNRFDEAMKLMQVRDIKKILLSAGALGAMMTGSGSAVYGIFETEPAAKNAAERLKGRGEIFLARPRKSIE